jgi:hypothetical protein
MLTPRGPTAFGQLHDPINFVAWDSAWLPLFDRVIVKYIQPGDELGHRQRGFTEKLAVALG